MLTDDSTREALAAAATAAMNRRRSAGVRSGSLTRVVVVVFGVFGWLACNGSIARSGKSFDEIQHLVAGKTESDVERILGTPDTRGTGVVDDEVWVWWDYTFLDGAQYPPELRGQVVHLEITFERPVVAGGEALPRALWRVAGPFSVNFSRHVSRS
jgi:hypothetical protein